MLTFWMYSYGRKQMQNNNRSPHAYLQYFSTIDERLDFAAESTGEDGVCVEVNTKGANGKTNMSTGAHAAANDSSEASRDIALAGT
jgi:hypothetical protein